MTVNFCGNCGAKVAPDGRFCSGCGTPFAVAAETGKDGPGGSVSETQEESAETVIMQWSHGIKMLSNRQMWKNFLLVLVLPIVVLGVIFSFLAGVQNGTLLIVGGVSLFAVIWLLVGIVVDIAGGFKASYNLTTRGVYFSSGKGARATARVATIGGILAGSAGAAGAGLLAEAEQDAFIAWGNIRKLSISTGGRYIQLRAGFGSKPIGLYGTADNFPAMLDIVRNHAPKEVL